MSKTISRAEFETNLQTSLDALTTTRETLVIEDDGEPAAVVLSPQEYAELRREWEWSIVDRIHEQNKDVDPDVK